MAHHDEYYYNEHDESQVEKILKTKKKKKIKRRVKILLFLMIFIMIGAYFMSDYSRVQSITIVGNDEVKSEDILEKISVSKKSIYLLVNTGKIEDEVKSIPLVKKTSVTKDLFGHIRIEIEEADKVAYCVIGKITYVIDELGNISETTDSKMIESLQSSPQLIGFKDVKFLEKFAKQYIRIPELIKNQTSDIIYSPKSADESRMKFLMVNGKILYLRVETMADQLSRFDYEAFMTTYSDRCEFSFEGDNVYMEKCK